MTDNNIKVTDRNFGDKLYSLIDKSGYTKAEICDLLEITPQALYKWVNGYNYPEVSHLIRLCRLLNVSADYLLSTQETEDYERGDDYDEERLL